jgi:hypothetical protein
MNSDNSRPNRAEEDVMKKNSVSFLFVAMLSIAIVIPAFAEENVPLLQGATTEEVKGIVDGLRGDLLGKKGAISELKAAADDAKKNADAAALNAKVAANKVSVLESTVSSLTGATTSNTVATKENTDAIQSVGKKVEVATKFVAAETKNLGDQAKKNAWLSGGIIGGVFVIAVILIWALYVRNRKNETADKDEILEAVSELGNKVVAAVAEVPAKTAKEVHSYFNPTPFEWDLKDEHIVYEFPFEDKCYRTFMVVDTDGSTNPADFEQQIVSSGYKAKNFCIGTFKKFREGKLAGKAEEMLIKHLITTGKIKITKK